VCSPGTEKSITETDYRPQIPIIPPPLCDHTDINTPIWVLTAECDEVRSMPWGLGIDKVLLEEVADITQDTQQVGEEVRSLRIRLANPLTFAARAAPAALQDSEDMG
jgi:hypothetical protein